MKLTSSQLVQYLANGFTVAEISKETGVNTRTIESKILVLRKSSYCKTYAHLVATFLRKKIIE